MKLPPPLHSWALAPAEAIALQRTLAERVVRKGAVRAPRLVAGADLAFSPDGSGCIAGVVVWDVPARRVIEQVVVCQPTRFPYVPGLLSFREGPALVAAVRRLRSEPEAFLFDGQGYAHPRRFGLACHMGVLLDRPTVGCAKSILVGECQPPAASRGSTSDLVHQGQRIGVALRTRDGVQPVYVSIGHRIGLADAVRLVLACGAGFRLPEPTRLADQLVRRTRSRRGRPRT